MICFFWNPTSQTSFSKWKMVILYRKRYCIVEVSTMFNHNWNLDDTYTHSLKSDTNVLLANAFKGNLIVKRKQWHIQLNIETRLWLDLVWDTSCWSAQVAADQSIASCLSSTSLSHPPTLSNFHIILFIYLKHKNLYNRILSNRLKMNWKMIEKKYKRLNGGLCKG